MQARFLLGPAGSGKTFRCLTEIREELLRSPEGPPLILLAPKQATFQLERQLLGWERPRELLTETGDGSPGVSPHQLSGYTRLQILSFERLAQFVFDQLRVAQPEALSEEGRVMVLRALLMQRQGKLKVFHAAARLNGFAQQLSLLLREFQRHHLSSARLDELSARSDLTPHLRDKLHDLALLLRSYADWLKSHDLRDANDLLDAAKSAQSKMPIAGLWLDGFAEMTPQELELLAAVLPFCERATLAFCLESEPQADPSWLSTWSVVGQTFRRCHARLSGIAGCEIRVEELPREPGRGRFAANQMLVKLEANWSGATSFGVPPLGGSGWPSTTSPDRPKAELRTDSVRLVTCADPEAEAVLAAREILQFVRDGARYHDCAVIVRDLEPYHATLGRVFRRYEIPFFMDRREPVAHHPLAELTRFAFRTVAFGWRHDDWFGALKSGLAPAREDEIDALENEALARGWEGKVWRSPLSSRTETASLERFEKLRQCLVPPFEKLAANLAANAQPAAPTGTQVATALREFWDALNVGQTLERWSAAASEKSAIGNRQPAATVREHGGSAIHTTVLDQMHDWLDNLTLAFPTEALSLREWLPILEAGLANLTVGVIPPALDQVLIGAVDRSRNPDLKLALVLGLNEGVFPAPPTPGVLLTDADRAVLAQDVFLGPTTYQRLGHERYLGYIACTRASRRLVLTRAVYDAAGQPLNPSPFFEHVKQLTGVTEENCGSAIPWWQSEHACELAAPILAAADVRRRMAIESPVPPPHVGGYNAHAQTSLLELAELPSLAPLVAKWRQLRAAASTEKLTSPTIENLFGRELASSVSGLEDFAACPFKFFAARGLRLEERKEFQFDDRDKGSFQHEVLREFHRRVSATGRLWRHLNTPEASIILDDIARDLLPQFEGGKLLADGAARFTSEVLIERLEQLVGVLIDWMAQYEFDPTRVELGFGLSSPEDMPAWRLELADGRVLLLRGRIDRVDLCYADEETALAVVMDYKSRVRKLHPVKLHHGLELQLLSYLGVLRHLRDPKNFFGVKRLVPAGVFYVPLNGGGGRPGAGRADVLAAGGQERRAAYQHSGCFLADELAHFDNRGESKGDQFKYAKNKGGELSARGNDALPAAKFEAMREKIEGHLRDYAGRIFQGEVAVSPFRIGNQTACDYCDFRAVCRFDPWTQPFRALRPKPKPAKETVKNRKAGRTKK